MIVRHGVGHSGLESLNVKENKMKSLIKIAGSLALIAFVAGCAQLGIPAPAEQPTFPASVQGGD